MDLEARVKAYAEEARRILIQRLLDARGQKGQKAFWQGYSTNGNGIVKLEDGKYKVVKVIGNIVLPKDSIVYIDEQNTVDVGFRRQLPATKTQGKQQIKPVIAERIKRPLLIVSDDEKEVFGWIVIYHSASDIFNANNNELTLAWCDNRQYYPFYQTYDYDSDTHQNAQPATHGKCLRVSAVYAWGYTATYGTFNGTASATASLGSLSAQVDLTASGSYIEDYEIDYAIEETGQSQDAECEAQTSYNSFLGFNVGEAYADADTHYFQFPNAKIYIQWPDDQNGNANWITLDLNNYVDYSVYKFDRARNYVKLDTNSQNTILYHTYSVLHVDTSYEGSPVSTTRFVPYEGPVTTTTIKFGKIYRGILHLRTDLSTGSTTSRYTPVEGYDADDYLGYIFYNDNGAMQIWDAQNAYWWSYFNDPQALWQNAFEGDWISEFSGIAWDSVAEANITPNELRNFLEISWDPVNETWNNGLNSDPPYSVTYGLVYYYDPSATVSQQWLDGQPHYNDYQDIENLGYVVRFSSTSTEAVPGIDDFVEVDMAGINDPLLPNYQYRISGAEANYNDRIEKAFISYLAYPEQQENGGYP